MRSVPLALLAYLSGSRRSKWRRWRTKTLMYPYLRLFCGFLYICLYGVPPAPLSDKIGTNKGIREWRTTRKLRHKCATVRHSPCSEPLPEPSAARTLVGCKSETLPFFAYAIVTHGTMAVLFA